MNERIRELVIQAEEYAFGEIDKIQGPAEMFFSKRTFDKSFREKFAELIIRECMDVASPSYMSTPEQGVYYVEQAIDRIAEHFGVK